MNQGQEREKERDREHEKKKAKERSKDRKDGRKNKGQKPEGGRRGREEGTKQFRRCIPMAPGVVWGPRKLASLIGSLSLPVSVQMNLRTPPSEPWDLASLCIFLIAFYSRSPGSPIHGRAAQPFQAGLSLTTDAGGGPRHHRPPPPQLG